MNKISKYLLFVFLVSSLFITPSLYADVYTETVSKSNGNYIIDPAHDYFSLSPGWELVDFSRSFPDPLNSVRVEVWGTITFPQYIDSLNVIHEATPSNGYEIGPYDIGTWFGTGIPFSLGDYRYDAGDGSRTRLFSLDSSGNFYSTDITNNVGSRAGSSLFSSFSDGRAGFGIAIGYTDPFFLGQPDWTFYNAGSVNVSDVQLSISTSEFLQPTVVPEPISSILFVTGGAFLAGRRFTKKKRKA